MSDREDVTLPRCLVDVVLRDVGEQFIIDDAARVVFNRFAEFIVRDEQQREGADGSAGP